MRTMCNSHMEVGSTYVIFGVQELCRRGDSVTINVFPIHAIKAYGGGAPLILNLVDRGEWSALHHGHFAPGERSVRTVWRRENSNHCSSVVQPGDQLLYLLSYPG